MLCEKFALDDVKNNLVPYTDRKPFPPCSDRAAWDELCTPPLNAARKALLVKRAEALAAEPWEVLPPIAYMDFIRTGDRHTYEQKYFRRRCDLGVLVLAECMEGQGRFLDAIINGILLICEETTWTLPAHVERREKDDWKDLLPDPAKTTAALFSCETAAVLAEVSYLLGEQLDAVSPVIRERIRSEVDTRIFVPVETRDDFLWCDGHNNWTPWCCSNTLGAALYLMDDPDRLTKLTYRMMGYVDKFIGTYGPDGGCDEGPGYWGAAGGAMLRFLEHLMVLTDGAVSIYDEPLIKAMGQYVVNGHLDADYFTNFSDGPPRNEMKAPVVYRYGQRVDDAPLMNLALLSMRKYDPAGKVDPLFRTDDCGGDMLYMLRELWWIPADAVPVDEPVPKDVWLPDLQVMVAREDERPGKGLVLAAKAGHNFENHNHNDIGQFIIMRDGQPVIVDAGVATYTRETFDDRTRWALWYIRASGHNIPVINGYEQQYGTEFTARDVEYIETRDKRMLQLDMAPAYPVEAGLEQATRTVLFDPAVKTVHVTDYVDTGESTKPLELTLNLLSPLACTVPEPGRVSLGGIMDMKYDAALFSVEISDIPLTDDRMRTGWGEVLRKISLSGTAGGADCAYALEFTEA